VRPRARACLRGARLTASVSRLHSRPSPSLVQVAYIYWGISGYLDAKDLPHVKKLQTASAAYFKQGDKRTALDVLEHFGEVNPQFKQYLFYDVMQIEASMGTLSQHA